VTLYRSGETTPVQLAPTATTTKTSARQPSTLPRIFNDATHVVGLDPGRRDLFTATEKCINSEYGYTTEHLSNREYYAEAGFKRRQAKLKTWLKKVPELETIQLNMPSSKVTTVSALQLHLSHLLLHLEKLLGFYGARRHRRQSFGVYRKKIKTLDKFCRRLSRGDPATVVAFGDGMFSSSSRGHAAAPVKGLRSRLRQHCRVVDVDEFRTSKLCSDCHSEVEEWHGLQRVHSVRICTNQSCRPSGTVT